MKRFAVAFLLLSISFVGCGGGDEFVDERDLTQVNVTADRRNIIGIADTISAMARDGEPVEEFIAEQTPTFEAYVADEDATHHAQFEKVFDIWQKLTAASDKAEITKLAKELKDAANEIE